MTIQELLAEDQFWNSEVLVSRPESEAEKGPRDPGPIAKKLLKAVAGVAFAGAFVLQPAAVQSKILYRSQEIDLSSLREVRPEVVDWLEASDLHKRAPDLERGSRILRRLKTVTAFDEYV